MNCINMNPNNNPEVFAKGCDLAQKELERLISKLQKKSSEKHNDLFTKKSSVLNAYGTREEIEEAYGWDFITKAERDRLLATWDASETQPMPEDFTLAFLNRCLADLQDFITYEPKAHEKTNEKTT